MKPTTISLLQKYKQEKKRFATITAYDYSFAKLFADEGLNVMLVGDSLGMTVQGHDSTLPVTVADIAYHTAAVRRGAPNCLLLADLPFMAYATPEQAFENAATVMRAGANMVKIEGGEWLVETVQMLTERAVPVCGHLGLTPQSVNIFGGYKVQGRGDEAGDQLLSDALALEAAGAQLLVLECVPVELAKRITECLFSGSLSALSEADFEQLAQDGVPMVEMEKGADLMQALVDSELQPSRGQARKTIASNAITINGEKQSDPEYFFKEEDRLFGRFTLLRRGKKNYCLICWK